MILMAQFLRGLVSHLHGNEQLIRNLSLLLLSESINVIAMGYTHLTFFSIPSSTRTHTYKQLHSTSDQLLD
jgi:hypothetical protein